MLGGKLLVEERERNKLQKKIGKIEKATKQAEANWRRNHKDIG